MNQNVFSMSLIGYHVDSVCVCVCMEAQSHMTFKIYMCVADQRTLARGRKQTTVLIVIFSVFKMLNVWKRNSIKWRRKPIKVKNVIRWQKYCYQNGNQCRNKIVRRKSVWKWKIIHYTPASVYLFELVHENTHN